ncbi:hypothetical protein [Mesorhizobium sp. 1B3]|uniref:hypothetical protein n=1 Tax=Mesorhizobium sp. 1B3 TaxID=3243599 RepID=UPI003D9869AD
MKDRFAADMEGVHRVIVSYSMNLRTSCADYWALQRLHDALLATVSEVTGKEAPWIGRTLTGPRTSPDK